MFRHLQNLNDSRNLNSFIRKTQFIDDDRLKQFTTFLAKWIDEDENKLVDKFLRSIEIHRPSLLSHFEDFVKDYKKDK